MGYMQDLNLVQVPGGDSVLHSFRSSLRMAHLSSKDPVSSPGDRPPRQVFREQEVDVH